jgi:translation elongation factor EF-Tu-like GTPase
MLKLRLWVCLFALVAIAGLARGCKKPPPPTRPLTSPATSVATMNFIIEHVFYIKPPVDRVILVGTIQEGTVRAGQLVVVHTSAGDVNATIEGIEMFKGLDVQQASKGQQVGLRLTGIRKDQPVSGDHVTAR